MLLAAGREVVSKTSAYNITKLSYRVEVRVINDGAGLLMGKNSPFKNIPVLGWLLQLFRRDVYKSKVLCFSSLSLTFIVELYG